MIKRLRSFFLKAKIMDSCVSVIFLFFIYLQKTDELERSGKKLEYAGARKNEFAFNLIVLLVWNIFDEEACSRGKIDYF
jgi:hypothetical protein